MQLENLTKKHILPAQLMVTIIISYLTIYGPAEEKWVVGSYIFIAIFFSTNLLLSYIPNRYYYDKKIFVTTQREKTKSSKKRLDRVFLTKRNI